MEIIEDFVSCLGGFVFSFIVGIGTQAFYAPIEFFIGLIILLWVVCFIVVIASGNLSPRMFSSIIGSAIGVISFIHTNSY
jgi:hypothetical protein